MAVPGFVETNMIGSFRWPWVSLPRSALVRPPTRYGLDTRVFIELRILSVARRLLFRADCFGPEAMV